MPPFPSGSGSGVVVCAHAGAAASTRVASNNLRSVIIVTDDSREVS